MKGEKRQISGYTIIEVLIVLAVSGVIFLSAVTFISGKQAKTAFRAGVGETASRIEDVIQQVNDGHFTDINFTCTPTALGPTIAFAPASVNSTQGSNKDCVFVGKFIRFQISPDSTSYQIFQLAGNREISSGKPATTLAEVKPVPIIDSLIPPVLDLTLDQIMPQRLSVLSVKVTDNLATDVSAHGFGIVQGFGSLQQNASNSYENGSQSVTLIEANTVPATGNPRSYILSDTGVPTYPSVSKVVICITDETRYATITIGENKNQLGVSVKYVNVCS